MPVSKGTAARKSHCEQHLNLFAGLSGELAMIYGQQGENVSLRRAG